MQDQMPSRPLLIDDSQTPTVRHDLDMADLMAQARTVRFVTHEGECFVSVADMLYNLRLAFPYTSPEGGLVLTEICNLLVRVTAR